MFESKAVTLHCTPPPPLHFLRYLILVESVEVVGVCTPMCADTVCMHAVPLD